MRILILGGGISGLSAAWVLKRKYPQSQITLLEKSHRLGGAIWTERESGFLFEKGPRTFAISRSPHLLQLIREVGLEKNLIFSDPSASRRYLWHRNKLRSVSSLLPRMLPALLKEPFVSRGKGEDESIADFAKRRFSARVATDLFDPITLGIYAGDINKLSVRSCFPKLFQWEQEKGSVLRGFFSSKSSQKGLFTLRNGMESLITALQEQLPIEIALNTPVESIGEKEVRAGGKTWQADLVVSALPSPFEKASLSIVNLAFEGDVLPKKGYGYLVPSREKEKVLGMIWDSAIFPQQNQGNETRLTAFLRDGGIETALEAASRHLKITRKPLHASCYEAREAIPQFEVGYAEKLSLYKQGLPYHLVGNYLEGPSVEDCVKISNKFY